MHDCDSHAEGHLIFRAIVTDTVSRETIRRYSFIADSLEEAREMAWKRAGKFGGDVFVKVEQLSR